jgi:hypothetical protein
MEIRELWLYNPTSSDVSISDLGVKVPAGKAVNVYKANPYLTTAKVQESVNSGAVARRIDAKILKIVSRKPALERPKILDQIKSSDKPIIAKKTKSSVVIERGMTEEDLGENGTFEFADYGVDGQVSYTKDKESVVVTPKVGEEPKKEPTASLEPKVESGISRQTQIVMDLASKSSHPMGKLAGVASRSDQPFIVSEPPTPNPEPVFEVAPKPSIKQVNTDTIVIESKGKSEGTVVSETEDADKVINMAPTDIMKVATKKEDGGAIIMELLEEKTVEGTTEEKPKVVNRSKRTKESKL